MFLKETHAWEKKANHSKVEVDSSHVSKEKGREKNRKKKNRRRMKGKKIRKEIEIERKIGEARV